VVGENLRMQIGQLDRIAQDLDLLAEPTDLLVGHVRDLFEDDLLHRRLGQLLERVVRARVDQHVVAGLELLRPQRGRERDHALLVGVTQHDRAVIAEEIHHVRDLAPADVAGRLDHVERLVQHDELTLFQRERVQVGMHVDAHRLSVHQDFGRAVFVRAGEHPIGVRRSAQLVDLFLQELDLLLGLLEHAHELLVLALGVRELLARHLVAASNRIELREHAFQPTAELGGIAAKETDRVLQVFDLVLVRPRPLALAITLRVPAAPRPRR